MNLLHLYFCLLPTKQRTYLFQQQIRIRRAASNKMFGEMQEGGERVGREVVAAAALQHVRDD